MELPEAQSEPVGARRVSARFSLGARLAGLVVFATSVAVLAAAVRLSPDSRGYGTHQQMGFGPCGMLVTTGLPCPTCGMTTAFSHAVRGQFVRSFFAQPGGLILALAAAAAPPIALYALVRGKWPRWLARIQAHWLFWGLLLVLLGGWAFTLTHGLLTGKLPVEFVRG